MTRIMYNIMTNKHQMTEAKVSGIQVINLCTSLF